MVIFTALKVFIGIVILMAVVGIARTLTSRTTGKAKAVKEVRKIGTYDEQIKAYEADPETAGMTEDDYLYYCYMADHKVNGISLRKAVTFQTTCEVRGINTVSGMQGILGMDEIYGDMKGMDCQMLYELGERVSRIAQDRKRVEKAK